jgi:site-specific recombinase XerD
MSLKSNKQIIEEFLKELDRKGLSERSKRKYLITLNHFFRACGKIKLNKLNKRHIDKFFFWLKNHKMSDESKDNYWIRFRVFVRWLKPKIDLSCYKMNVKKRVKLPEEILNIEEIKRIIEACSSVRDRAMLSLLYDAGLRPSELVGLTFLDVIFDDDGLVLNVNGKTGQRRIRVITTLSSDKFLKDYLKTVKPEGRIFKINIERLNQLIKELAKRVGIKKKVTTYSFRHSRATHLAKYLTEAQMKVYFGWSMDSDMVATYVHLSGRDLDEKVFELNQKEFLFIPSESFKEFLYELYKRWKENKAQILPL